LKQCTNCRGNLADFVPLCPYRGVSQPVPEIAMAQQEFAPPQSSNKAIASLVCGVLFLCAPAGATELPVSVHARRKRFGTSTGFCIGGSTGTAKFNRQAIFLPG
jgi:hypothetical protein